MLSTYTYPTYSSPTPAEITERRTGRYPVVIVGAGPVGLSMALELALTGTKVVILDDDKTVSVGSRGVCYAKRALEVIDRYGVAETMLAKGVSWNVGRTFFREDEVYRFNLLPQPDHRFPGMINLQQYYLEQYLVERALATSGIDLRFLNKVIAVQPKGQGATVEVETPDGSYTIEADWLVVADGARSPIRRMLGLDIEGKIFTDRFLIADVVMKADFPTERWFWFDPPFHPNQSVLLHKQADSVWRIDFQLGWQADPEEEKKPENVIPRIKAMLGPNADFELEWVSVYTFQCRRMSQFRQGRVLFVGDAAHQVSPFGARGANSGIQDVDNLGWKLRLVMAGQAPEALLDTYDVERAAAADENIMNSTRSTDFITPKSTVSRTFRNAVLGLANEHAFARSLVNSGRLSVPSYLTDSPLNTPDREAFAGDMVPGAPIDDAPVGVVHALGADTDPTWLLRVVRNQFVLMLFADPAGRVDQALVRQAAALRVQGVAVQPVVVLPTDIGPSPIDGAITLVDGQGRCVERYDGQPGTAYLIRPDQHVAARWRKASAHDVQMALQRALGLDLNASQAS